jgi:hypothetical protein
VPAKPMEHGSDKTPFQVFMSSFWNEAGDLYLGSFENALNRFLSYADQEQRREFVRELEEVGRRGLVGDITTPNGRKYWSSLGGRALSKQEYMLALRTLASAGT